MADFCKQCSTEIFGEDYKDLCGITKEEDTKAGQYAVVLCEGCVNCLVDHTGTCVSAYCEKAHGAL